MSLKVGIIMGSTSDWSVMTPAAEVLKEFGIEVEVSALSAHRTPDKVMEYAKTARARGLSVVIAAAGGAAHLPGVVASLTSLPVIGVPVKSRISLDGWDSLLSIVQMPAGIPVATVAIDGARNAGILAIQMIGVGNAEIAKKLDVFKQGLYDKVVKDNEKFQSEVASI
jgi:5-(carboxyamino)imidazole ribonucleotide mutase